MLAISQVETPAQVAAIRDVLHEYIDWTSTVEGDAHDAPTFKGIGTELDALPGIYAPPRGRLLLATVDGHPAGCIALKPVDDRTVELKRLYVRPAFRGHRIGEGLVATIVEEARRIGYERIV